MATVRHNEAQSRYELETEHGLAIAVYRQQGDRLVFTHTEVPPADEGKGIGARLVRAALDDTRKRGFKIVPACSFVVAFVRRHPEYDDAHNQQA
jgi:predicted GNAT family acetyltransferase